LDGGHFLYACRRFSTSCASCKISYLCNKIFSSIVADRTQVSDKKYDTELTAHGVTDILRLAIAVEGKELIVEQV